MNNKKIIYWSPHLTHIGTINSILNSIKSLKKFSHNQNIEILNVFGEWSQFEKKLQKYNVNLVNFFNPKINKYVPRNSFLKSRFSYILFFISTFYKLKKFLEKNKNEILIVHLLTSLPIIIVTIFNLKINLILRISGKVNYNILRKIIWKLCCNKIRYITCPSIDAKKDIIKLGIFEEKKILVLYDPIIDPKKINQLKKEKLIDTAILNTKYILSIGRLTKQKNYIRLISFFKNINIKYPEYNLVILGSGEDYYKLKEYIKRYSLEKKIFLLGFKENIYSYLKYADVFISTSKYEDPGASIVQSIYCNKYVISSNCKNGPSEILLNGDGGTLYDDDKITLESAFEEFKRMSINKKKNIIIKAKKNIMKYTTFRHYINLTKIFSSL